MENKAKCMDCMYYNALPKGPKGGEYGTCNNEKHGHNKRSAFNRCCSDFEQALPFPGPMAAADEPMKPRDGIEVEILQLLKTKRERLIKSVDSNTTPLATKAKLKSNIELLDEIIDWIEKEMEVC
jgi:hypothetical protein